MSTKIFLHELEDFDVLIERVRREHKNVLEQLIEKDYWIMHCLWGLKEQGFEFELKGGTSLSKGYGIIDRFSEDIDIKIQPPDFLEVKTGRNHDKPKHIEGRLKFYDWLAEEISIPGIQTQRDTDFDDSKARNAGIRLIYDSLFSQLEGVKPYVLLELGFDVTTPNEKRPISSWVYDFAKGLGLEVTDNRALDIPCYLPGYTLIEKLSAISRKYRQEQEGKILPLNFIRHYYDVYQLLADDSVLEFIGTEPYQEHKAARFQKSDETDLSKNEAFVLKDKETRRRYADEYSRTKTLYYDNSPSFDTILERIKHNLEKL